LSQCSRTNLEFGRESVAQSIYSGNSVRVFIKRARSKFECSVCNSKNVVSIRDGERTIKGLKSGSKQTYFIVPIHRLKCSNCNSYRYEKLDFISRPKVHYTRSLERSIIELRSEMTIKAAAVDLAPSYSAWLRETLPDTDIVYDHFHLIKLMFDDLGTACFLKEALRTTYSIAESEFEAESALNYWCELAIASEISSMKTMANTIKKNMEGIKGYWKHDKLTSAGMEGVNNKIGWLNKQAYGYRDEEYFKFKIFDLPTVTIDKDI
jgi:transposase